MHLKSRSLLALAVGSLSLAACGGGGGGAAVAPPVAPLELRPVTMSITVPAAGAPFIVPRDARRAGGVARRPAYVSPGTTQVAVFINGSASAAAVVPLPPAGGSPATRDVTLNAPNGVDTFRVDLRDAVGVQLATGTVTQDVSVNNIVAVTTLGIPAMAVFGVADAQRRPASGTPAVIPLNLTVTDADGFAITGTFSHQVTVVATPPGILGYTESTRFVTNAAQAAALTVAYNGAPNRGDVFATLNDSQDPKDAVADAVFRPGALPAGRNALVAFNTGATSTLKLVDTSSYAQAAVTGGSLAANVTALAAAPNGTTAYAGLTNGNLAVYDGATKAVTGTVNLSSTTVNGLTFDDRASHAYAVVTRPAGFGVADILVQINTSVAFVALPAAATACAGIAENSRVVWVSCSNATYRVDMQTAVVTALSPSTGGAAIAEYFSPGLIYATYPVGLIGAFPGPSTTTLAAPASIALPGATVPIGLALDPSQRFLYVGANNAIVTLRVKPDGTGTPVRSVATASGLTTHLVDFPGSASRAPDATVWGTTSSGALLVLDTATNTIVQNIAFPGISDVVFVP